MKFMGYQQNPVENEHKKTGFSIELIYENRMDRKFTECLKYVNYGVSRLSTDLLRTYYGLTMDFD